MRGNQWIVREIHMEIRLMGWCALIGEIEVRVCKSGYCSETVDEGKTEAFGGLYDTLSTA